MWPGGHKMPRSVIRCNATKMANFSSIFCHVLQHQFQKRLKISETLNEGWTTPTGYYLM